MPIAVLCGGTEWGVPKIAAEMAKKFNLPVIGVYPERGKKYALEDLDLSIEIAPRYKNSEWGDESEVLVKLSDAVIIIGGSFGTQIEYSHAMKINEGRIKYGLEPIYLIPILGVGGWSENIFSFSIPDELRICFSETRITIGNIHEITSFLKERILQK